MGVCYIKQASQLLLNHKHQVIIQNQSISNSAEETMLSTIHEAQWPSGCWEPQKMFENVDNYGGRTTDDEYLPIV